MKKNTTAMSSATTQVNNQTNNQKGFSTMTNTTNNTMATNTHSQREINRHLSTVSRLFNQSVRNSTLETQMAEMNTTSAILAKIALSKGLGVKTKNYALITAAITKGYSVSAIMADPSLAGVPGSQHRWFAQFLQENNIPKALTRPTRKRVKVTTASVNVGPTLISDGRQCDAEVIALGTDTTIMSESQLSEIFGIEGSYDEMGHPYIDMTHLIYVNLKIEEEENIQMKMMQERIVREGFEYEVNGETHRAVFFLQTASQARQLQAVFIRESYMDIPSAFKALGHDFKTYSKRKWDGTQYVYTLDVTKYLKRPGLSGTSTIVSQAVSFPNARVIEMENEEYKIVSDNHSIMVVNDRFAKLTNGTFKAFHKNRVVTVTATDGVFVARWTAKGQMVEEVLPMSYLKLGAGDGMLLADEEIYWALKAEFGEDSDAWQIRLTPFGKGLLVFVPGLRNYYDANIVAFKSAIKGDYRLMTDEEGYLTFGISMRIARFAKKPGKKAEYTTFPYQFTHVTSLTFENMKALIDPQLEQVKNVLNSPELIQKYAGVAHLENMEDMTSDEVSFMRNRSLVSTFSNFMHYAPFTFEDAWMKQQALRLMNDEVSKWVAGTIPVNGQYRFMVQDPYALLKAVRDDEGDMVVPAGVGLKEDATFMMERDGIHPMLGKVASLRNPAITKGEGRVLNGAAPQDYLMAATKGAFSSVCVMSVHDMNTFAEGGADNDGDETFVTQEPIILSSLSNKQGGSKFIPMLDLYVSADGEWESGCPFKMDMDSEFYFAAPHTDYDGQFKVKFIDEEYTPRFVNAIHDLSKEYVIRTLTPNKIGFLTDIATRMADTIRKVGYMIMDNTDEYGSKVDRTDIAKKELVDMIARYEYMMDLLRLCIGWEIDRAKHGGAYEEQLQDELEFVQNPPKYAGFVPNGKKQAVWINAAWMRHHKGKDGGVNTGSVMSKLYDYMTKWTEENIYGKGEQIASDVDNNNILHVFDSSYAMDPARYEEIKTHIKAVKYSYVTEMSEMIKLEQRLAIEAEIAGTLVNDTEIKALRGDCVERHQMMMSALEMAYESHELGYVAYKMTYTERGAERKASIAFPWTVAKKQFLDLCAMTANREVVANPYVVAPANVKVNYRVADGRDPERMAIFLNNVKEAFVEYVQHPVTGNWAHMVFIDVNGSLTYAGDLYKNQTAYFTGASKYKVTLNNAEAKKQAMFLTISSIERV